MVGAEKDVRHPGRRNPFSRLMGRSSDKFGVSRGDLPGWDSLWYLNSFTTPSPLKTDDSHVPSEINVPEISCEFRSEVLSKDWRRVTRQSNMFVLKNCNTPMADPSIG